MGWLQARHLSVATLAYLALTVGGDSNYEVEIQVHAVEQGKGRSRHREPRVQYGSQGSDVPPPNYRGSAGRREADVHSSSAEACEVPAAESLNPESATDSVNVTEEILNYLDRIRPERLAKTSEQILEPQIAQNWPGPAAYEYSRLLGSTFRYPQHNEIFDYIVVGGGGVGCPLARTLAEYGYKTLLIERGGLRESNPLTWTKETISVASNEEKIAQPIVTTDGVITHVANVLGGGTSVNYGIYIEEEESFPARFGFDVARFADAQKWVRQRVAHPTQRSDRGYLDGVRKFFRELARNKANVGMSPAMIPGAVWEGYTLFDKNGFRTAADTLIGRIGEDVPGRLTVSVNTKATKIEFREDGTGRKVATCVQIRPSVPTDHAPLLGKPKSALSVFENYINFRNWLRWYPRVSNIASRLLPPPPPMDPPARSRVCLGWQDGEGEIIVSAGALMSPWLLYQSGVGPTEVIRKLGVPLVANVSMLGRNLGDRPFVPIGFFHTNETVRPQSIVRSITLTNVTYRDLMLNAPEDTLPSSTLLGGSGRPSSLEFPDLLQAVASEDAADLEEDADAEFLGLQVVLGLKNLEDRDQGRNSSYNPDLFRTAQRLEDDQKKSAIDETDSRLFTDNSGLDTVEALFEAGFGEDAVAAAATPPAGHPSGAHPPRGHPPGHQHRTAAGESAHASEYARRAPAVQDAAEYVSSASWFRNPRTYFKFPGFSTTTTTAAPPPLNTTEAGPTAYEEVSGGKFAEGVLGQRTFVPPPFRSSVFLDLAMELGLHCAARRDRRVRAPPFKATLFSALCPIMNPVLACFERSAAQIWLLPNPEARGFIGVGGPDGKTMTVTANYLRNPNDLANAAKGMGWLIQRMNATEAFTGLLERWDEVLPSPNEQCPLVVRGRLAVLLNRVAQLLETFVPSATFNRLEHAVENPDEALDAEGLRREIFRLIAGKNSPNDLFEPDSPGSQAILDAARELQRSRATEGLIPHNFKYLSFPPLLPSPLRPRDVVRLVKRTISSMWHWHGSAALGSVTDPETFEVDPEQLVRLSIVDASIVPELPRANPQAFLMALGRYAGEQKALRRRQHYLASQGK